MHSVADGRLKWLTLPPHYQLKNNERTFWTKEIFVNINPHRKNREQRVKCEVNISHDIVIPDIHYDGIISNLSSGGIYFESNEQILTGDEISIMVRKLNKEEITFDVSIIWKKELFNSSFRFGYGAKSINPKESISQICEQDINWINDIENKREHQRKIYNKLISLKNQNQNHNGRIRDISRGGAFIETDSIFPVGKKIALTISGKKDRKSVRFTGWIVRENNEGFGIIFDRRSGAERRYDIDRRRGPERRGNKKPDKKVFAGQFFPKKSARKLAELNMKHQPIF